MTPERLLKMTNVLDRRQPDLAVVMEDIEDQHNVFAVMRTCDAVGIQDIYVINTKFKDHKKTGKSSSSSAGKWLTIHQFEHREECMELVKSRYGKVLGSYLGEDTGSFYDVDFTESVALVFGNEQRGLSEEMLAYCDGTFMIPQVGMIQSLNISVACAVTLYEAKRQRLNKGFYDGTPRLKKADYEVLKEKWVTSGYKTTKR